MICLGDEAKDTVTGFSGVAVSRTEYLNGCTRVCLQPPIGKDGKLPTYEAFDEPQLRVLKVQKVPRGPTNTGGPDKYMPKPR
jgi:hypothetical protein